MKVPKYIQEAIKKCAKANIVIRENDKLVREWMYKNKIYNDSNIDCLIDGTAMSYNPEVVINHFENAIPIGNNGYEGDFED